MTSNQETLYTTNFILLCISHVLFAMSFTMILPELPQHLSNLGGAEYKGLIISLFTITAGLSRPFSGKLTDTIGRIPVMVIGTLFCVLSSFLYPFMTTVFGFLALRFLHGFSTGFKPTASTAYVADIVPAHRRGEAMGIMGVTFNIGAAAGPVLGGWMALSHGVNTMFYWSSFFAFSSIFILLKLEETLKNKQPFSMKLLRLKKDEVIDKSAISPALVVVFVYFSFGAFLTITPDQSTHLGIENKGMFFTYFTIFSILSRLFAGKASDKLGRVKVIKFAIICIIVALVFLAFVESQFMFYIGGSMLGFSTGVAAPAVFAWVIDRCKEENRGKALATVYIALEIGIGTGAYLSAWIFNNQAENFFWVWSFNALVTFGALLYLWIWSYKNKTRAVA